MVLISVKERVQGREHTWMRGLIYLVERGRLPREVYHQDTLGYAVETNNP